MSGGSVRSGVMQCIKPGDDVTNSVDGKVFVQQRSLNAKRVILLNT
ncbi:MAG: hypothetical protein AB4057_22115 [Crocosphaera sp.]